MSRSASPGTRSSAIARATPATAPRASGGVLASPCGETTTIALREPSTSQPLASSSRASSAPDLARRLGGEREPQPARDLEAGARAGPGVPEGREHRAPLRALGAERARHAHQVEPAVAVAAHLETHDAIAVVERGLRELGERALHVRGLELAETQLGGAVGEAPRVAHREAGPSGLDTHRGVASAPLGECGVVGPHDGHLERQQLAIRPAETAGVRAHAAGARRVRCSSGM